MNENYKHCNTDADRHTSRIEDTKPPRKHKLHTVYVRGADISKRIRCMHCNRKIADGLACSDNGAACLPERQANLKKWEATAR